jgi:hypothetical protein
VKVVIAILTFLSVSAEQPNVRGAAAASGRDWRSKRDKEASRQRAEHLKKNPIDLYLKKDSRVTVRLEFFVSCVSDNSSFSIFKHFLFDLFAQDNWSSDQVDRKAEKTPAFYENSSNAVWLNESEAAQQWQIFFTLWDILDEFELHLIKSMIPQMSILLFSSPVDGYVKLPAPTLRICF